MTAPNFQVELGIHMMQVSMMSMVDTNGVVRVRVVVIAIPVHVRVLTMMQARIAYLAKKTSAKVVDNVVVPRCRLQRSVLLYTCDVRMMFAIDINACHSRAIYFHRA